MKLYITRHGKTQWNIEGRFQGVQDSPLVDSGIRDANDLSNHIKDINFSKVYTSPLGRAKQTAKIVFKNKEIIEDSRISEMNFGVFEGMKKDDIDLHYHDLYDNLWNHPEMFTQCPNGGETFLDVKKRIVDFLEEMKQYDENENVFIVTHGMYFVCLLGYILGYEPKDFPKINRQIVRGCSITVVEINNEEMKVLCLGDDSFLVPEEKMSFIK